MRTVRREHAREYAREIVLQLGKDLHRLRMSKQQQLCVCVSAKEHPIAYCYSFPLSQFIFITSRCW